LLHASDAAVLSQGLESGKDASAEDGLREVLLVREFLHPQLAGAVIDDRLRTRMCELG
jgi:hypothetical protein